MRYVLCHVAFACYSDRLIITDVYVGNTCTLCTVINYNNTHNITLRPCGAGRVEYHHPLSGRGYRRRQLRAYPGGGQQRPLWRQHCPKAYTAVTNPSAQRGDYGQNPPCMGDVIKQSRPPRLSVCLFAINSKVLNEFSYSLQRQGEWSLRKVSVYNSLLGFVQTDDITTILVTKIPARSRDGLLV